jgi:glutathione synthase/RimK-type ligase-like ATP-grasp enzyme
MTKVVFATCTPMPAYQPGDMPIVQALESRGAQVSAAPWNGPFEPFESADLVVIRSTWDYFEAAGSFIAFLRLLEDVRGDVVNSPALMAWNVHKGYLLELAAKGAPLPDTRLSEPSAIALANAMDEMGLAEAVAKPIHGAGGSGLTVMRRDDASSLERAAGALAHDGLVQPLIPEIRSLGETSCTFFGGEFSHAVVKRPKGGSILVHEERGGSTQFVALESEQIAAAKAVLLMLPEQATFARIDMVFRAEGALLMEVEVIEPELFVVHADGASERFAELLMSR